ncbi:asparaginase [soil metagenome]
MQNIAHESVSRKIVILGTGGTIAGTAASASQQTGYTSAQIGVAELVAAIPSLAGQSLEMEQVAQIDSKDMDFDIWLRLAQRVAHHATRDDVAGIVITHGTDTLEETAYFLQRVLAPAKPVVLTAAMRPATSLQADGPQNMIDALAVARTPGVQGVLAVLAGTVHGARAVRKSHPYRLDAFGSGDAGPLAYVEDGALRCVRPWPIDSALGLQMLGDDAGAWPVVEIITSLAGARAATVQALIASGAKGLVVAATGNGSLHHALEAALAEAQAQGLAVLRSTRCLDGRIVGGEDATTESAGDLTPVKARIELMLRLLAVRTAG